MRLDYSTVALNRDSRRKCCPLVHQAIVLAGLFGLPFRATRWLRC